MSDDPIPGALRLQGGICAQVGSAFNYADNGVRLLRSIDNTHYAWQDFTTVGLFQRTDFGLNYGMVYDFRFERYYKNLNFGQWRGQIGYASAASLSLNFTKVEFMDYTDDALMEEEGIFWPS